MTGRSVTLSGSRTSTHCHRSLAPFGCEPAQCRCADTRPWGNRDPGHQSLRQLKEVDPEAHRAFVAVDDLKIEYSLTRDPVRWYQRRRQMAQLLRESPAEAKLYKRVQLQLLAWVLLFFASALAVVAAILG